MKNYFVIGSAVITTLFIAAGAAAAPFTIDDGTNSAAAYYGGIQSQVAPGPPGVQWDDLIFGQTDFSVEKLFASQSGGITTVVLGGPYFDSTIPTGAQPGDLYISTTGWRVNRPNDHARLDTFDQNEGWDYVVSFLNAKVYALDFSGITMSSSAGGINPVYRSSQAYRNGYGAVKFDTGVSVGLDPASQTLTFSFPDLGLVDRLGYHWTQECGNDVLEGGGTPTEPFPPVPEPTSLFLLSTGLAAAGLRRRR